MDYGYGMYAGGVQRCSALRKDGEHCGNRGYTIGRYLGYWCPHHRGVNAWTAKV